MATYEDPYDPIPARRRRVAPADVPRGGMPVPGTDPLAGVQERDILPEAFAEPDSPTRGMRYGPGDERDLSVPAPPPPAGWRPPSVSELPPARPDPTAPAPLFSGVAGEDFEATRRRGEQVARLMRETDGPFANPNDWNYIRSYGPRAAAQAVASGRANISGADPALVAQERERFLRNRTTDLSISPQLRTAARDELAQIERDAAEERRREMWAEEQAARLRMAEGANAATVEAARLTADGQIRAAQAKAAADAAAAEAAGKGKPVQLDPESPGLYVDGTFWKNPAYNPKPVTAGGNGIGRWNPDTDSWDFEWPDKGGAKKAPVTLKPGESYFDPETKETFVAPGTDRISIEAEIAGWQSAYVKTDSNKARAEIEKRIDEARKRLAALGGGESAPAAPAPAPVAAAAAPAATAEPAPAPVSAPAPAPASPTGHRRWTPGS